MKFHVLTLFPEMIVQGLGTSITGRAIKQNKIGMEAVNIRDFSVNKHKKVDDYTYGGGAGMLMQAQPVFDAYQSVAEAIPKSHRKRVIYVTPQGSPFHQKMAQEFAQNEDLIFLCGHYEGIDERVLEEIVTDYVSIGDYVLTGGELAAMVMIDAIARLVPGVLHNEVSAETESFHGNLLEYPQYSRPEIWHGKSVPEVLLSGNQKQIQAWRLAQSELRTRERRADLYEKYLQLKKCKELLLKEKLLHIDMIELIHQGRAELIQMRFIQTEWVGTELKKDMPEDIQEHVEKNPIEILLKDSLTGKLYHTVLDKTDDACKHTEAAPVSLIKAEILDNQDRRMVVWHKNFYTEPHKQEYFHAVYTKKERLPITGLYRMDGKPGPLGIVIQPLSPEKELALRALYTKEAELEEVLHAIKTHQMYGAFMQEKLIGAVGINTDGCLDYIRVQTDSDTEEEHIKRALFTYACNELLSQDRIPFMKIQTEDQEGLDFMAGMGFYLSKTALHET